MFVSSRSKSLDYRDGFRDDDPYFGDRGGRGVTIPIRQERPEERRNYDYDRDYDNRRQWVETPRGREIEIPMERIRTAKSSDYLDRIDRRPQYDDRSFFVQLHKVCFADAAVLKDSLQNQFLRTESPI